MQWLHTALSTFGAINVNATITIWSFFTNNLTILAVIVVIVYLLVQEVKLHEYDFIQDNRKIM